MISSERRAIKSLERMLESLADLRESVKLSEAAARGAMRDLQSGRDVRAIADARHPSEERSRLNASLDAVGRARHSLREAMFTLGFEQGMSVAELAEAWGISRQLANTYVHQTRQ